MAESAQNVTQILLACRGGNHEALQLLPLVYGELRRGAAEGTHIPQAEGSVRWVPIAVRTLLLPSFILPA